MSLLERPARVLVVEDDVANQVLLRRILERVGYTVSTVGNGEAALEAVRASGAEAVLLDVGLPGMDGFEVCRRLRDDPATATVAIILLTGRTSIEDVVHGLDAGADDFLGKPCEMAELLARMRSALRLREAMADMEAAHGVVATLANAIEAKDSTTESHCQRLAGYAHRIGEAAGVVGTDLRMLTYGALLHDIGKIGVAESILTKPGPLTDDEWRAMKRHPIIGEQICGPLANSRRFVPIIRHHHERWDGHGYPDGLRADAIPLSARIVAVADSFDAMVNDRPYRPALTVSEAIAELRAGAGRQFDPELVPILLELLAGNVLVPASGHAHAHG